MAPYTLLLSNGTKIHPARRTIFSISAILLLSILVVTSLWYRDETLCKLSLVHVSTCSRASTGLPATFIHRNIAVASVFGFHFDVYMSLVSSMQRVMKGGGHVQVYADTPFAFDFLHVSDRLGLYHGSFKEPIDLIDDLHRDPAIDMVVFGTCSADIGYWQDQLLAAWDARDNEHKFQLICIPHHQAGTVGGGWHDYITPWARRNAIRLLPIAHHVGNAFLREFQTLSSSHDPMLKSAGFDLIPIDVHAPILDIPLSPKKSARILSSAVIQGSFSEDRRAYHYIFGCLIQSLHANPASWGYLPLNDGPSFIHDPSLVHPPFKLHLLGSGWLDLPPELKNVVVFHTGLNYSEYYDVMAEMDVCIPAFGTSDEYYTLQASSTVAMCLETNVPILATPRIREAYSYIDDDRVSITIPAVMSDMDAIIALRSRNASDFLASDPSASGWTMGSNAAVRDAVEQMLAKGSFRSKAGFDQVKREVWATNDLVVKNLLEGLR